ncbi:unnamed protein product [Oreochromis niloticus]|nr:unnamed protein product [Mustela putorius furo]
MLRRFWTHTVLSVRAKEYQSARHSLGQLFHSLQDFYSHSNWVEMGQSSIYLHLLQPEEPAVPVAKVDIDGLFHSSFKPSVLSVQNVNVGILERVTFILKMQMDCLQDLEKDKIIDRLTYHRLYPGDAIPCIYGLPKIHKEGVPLRPIVSSINSATYNIAKHLATILAPLVGNTPHHIKNSTDKVQKLTLDPDETMQRGTKEDQTPAREDKKDRRNNVVIPYVAGVSEKLRRVFSKHNIPVYFRPSNTLRQKLVHPKDKTPKHRLNNVVYAVQCSKECPDLYIGETKQPLHKRMAQHRRATSTGQDSAVHLHLKDKGHSFEDANVHILDREDRWFERGVKEAIYVHCERPSLNRGGGLRHQLSAIYNPVLSSLPRRLYAHSHPGPSDLRNSHDKVTLLHVESHKNLMSVHTFRVDSSVKSVTLHVSGTMMECILTSPSDQSQSLLNEEGPLAVIQQFQGLYRISLFPPLQPGQWKLQAKSDGHLTFNVIGDSGVDFLYYFAIVTNETHPGLARVDGNPTAGVPAFLVVVVTGLGSVKEASFSHATLLGAEGESLQQVKLNSSPSSIYSLEELVGLVDPVPRVPFCIRLSGQDSRGNKLERVSTEMVEPTHIQIQVLSLPDLVPGQSAVVNFEIQNHGAARNFSLTADDDCGYLHMTGPHRGKLQLPWGRLTYRTIDPSGHHHFPVAGQRSFRDQVSLHTPATAQAGVTVTLTPTVNDLHSADSNYAVAYLTVVPQDSDTSPPSCSAARVQSNCSAICNATSWSVSLSVSDIGHSGLDALQLQEGEGILTLFHSTPTSEDSLGEPGLELQQTQRDKSTNGDYHHHHHQEQHNQKARLETGGPPFNISEWLLDVSQPLFVRYTSSCCSTQAEMLVWDKAGNMKRCHLTPGQKRQLQNKSTETSGTGQKMPTGFFFLLLGLLCFPLL